MRWAELIWLCTGDRKIKLRLRQAHLTEGLDPLDLLSDQADEGVLTAIAAAEEIDINPRLLLHWIHAFWFSPFTSQNSPPQT